MEPSVFLSHSKFVAEPLWLSPLISQQLYEAVWVGHRLVLSYSTKVGAQGRLVTSPKSHSYSWVKKRRKEKNKNTSPSPSVATCFYWDAWHIAHDFLSVLSLYLIRRKRMNFEVRHLFIQAQLSHLAVTSQFSNLSILSLILHRLLETIISTLKDSYRD